MTKSEVEALRTELLDGFTLTWQQCKELIAYIDMQSEIIRNLQRELGQRHNDA